MLPMRADLFNFVSLAVADPRQCEGLCPMRCWPSILPQICARSALGSANREGVIARQPYVRLSPWGSPGSPADSPTSTKIWPERQLSEGILFHDDAC
ncbi:hypothetical protein LAD77_01905 [Klebsiella pneumoniae]|nr:hypothetical protein [Klebsiella pneumoniae]